jgi:hypothetical protein
MINLNCLENLRHNKEKEKELLILDLKEGEKLRCKENAHCK